MIVTEQLETIHDNVLVSNMNFEEQVTTSGIIVSSDNGKTEGIKPRWGKVYKIGPDQHDVKIGDWILIEHGRWTRKIKIDDGENVKEIQKIEISAVLAVSDSRPSDVHIGQEFSHGSSATFSPDQFL